MQEKEKKSLLKVPILTNYFHDKSLSKEKVLEEIDELIEAVKKTLHKIHEAADVFYHLINVS